MQSKSTFPFKHHLTGEAWPACRAILPLHSNTTRQARHGQLAEQFYPFIQTIAIADHFPSKTFSFKHHLTGEAWPACRAILPFHSNTTCAYGQLVEKFYLGKHPLERLQARHGQLGYSRFARLATRCCVRLDTWVSYDVAYRQPLPWRCARRRFTATKLRMERR